MDLLLSVSTVVLSAGLMGSTFFSIQLLECWREFNGPTVLCDSPPSAIRHDRAHPEKSVAVVIPPPFLSRISWRLLVFSVLQLESQ